MIIDTEIQYKLLTDGFAVVGEVEPHTLQELDAQDYFRLATGPDFYYSLLNNDGEGNKKISETLRAILLPFFEKHFSAYRTISESYLIKPAHTQQELLLHQDWCYTDEGAHEAYNVWIPMADVTEVNGALFFVRGSHRWFGNKRSGSLHTGRISSGHAEIAQQLVTVSLKRGEVVLFHPAVFHGSWPNLSDKPRAIVTATVMDAVAPFLYYQKETDEEVSVLRMDDDEFARDLAPMTRGELPHGELLGRMPYTHVLVTEGMLIAKLAECGQDQ